MADDTTTMSTTVPPNEAEATQALATQPEAETGMTRPQKVAAGVGAAGATGLAAYGIFRLGKHFGWWGKDTGGIVIDDETGPAPSDGGGTTPSNGGGSNKNRRAFGNPPNISGDSAGYNTEQFPGPGPMRLALKSQGYRIRANEQPINPDDTPNAWVTQFQADWNKVIRGIDRGRVKLPTDVNNKKLLDKYRGILIVDGLLGKNSLNALEIVLTNYTKNAIFWSKLKEQTR